jgi:hypothetical protein
MKGIIITLTLLFTVFTISCTKHSDSNSNGNSNPNITSTPTSLTELLPEIKSFLNTHKELGTPAKSQPPTDWARGKKQRIILDDKRDLTFYIESGAVVTVYEEARDGRKTIWGEPIKN